MAKRDNGSKQTTTATTAATASGATIDAMEQRVIAFAEQLGRIAGTVQARAEGWMDREALNKQIASVRDGAAELLDQLADGMSKASKTAVAAAAKAKSSGRSGGVVDAPGKKHRKPMPKDRRSVSADARTATMRTGKAMMKTVKLRGRG